MRLKPNYRLNLACLVFASIFNQACNPIAQTDVGNDFNPGVELSPTSTTAPPVSFTQNWDFNSSVDYVRSSTSALDFNLSGNLELTPANQNDNATSGFSAANVAGVALDSNGNYLRLDHAGGANKLELDSSWTPAWNQLVGYWKLNDAVSSTSIFNSVTSLNSGSVFSGATLGNTGYLNSAASITGTGYITASATGLPVGAAARTMSAWIKLNTTSGNLVVAAYGSTNANQAFGITVTNGYLNNFGWSNDNQTNSTLVTAGVWSHVLATYDGTTSKVYLNGSLIGSALKSWSTVSTGTFYIGENLTNAGQYFNGFIDDVAVWNVALTPSAIASIYQHQLAKYAGTYTSRVMDALTSNPWTYLAPSTTYPFSKELPDTVIPSGTATPAPISEVTSDYSAQSSGLLTGISGLWHFDEPLGTGLSGALDRSGNNVATSQNAVTFGAPGILGTSASFDGSSSYIKASGLLGNATKLTLSGWFKINPNNTSGYELISIGNYAGLRVNDSGAGIVGFYYYGSGWQGTPTSIFSQGDSWMHAAYTVDTINHVQKIYLNGKLINTTNFMDAISYSNQGTDTYIGRHGSGGPMFFPGLIDEVATWSRALTDTEVMELYRRGANRVKYQVRTCLDATCSANPAWLGPDGSNQTYFSELNNNSVPKHASDLSGSDSVNSSKFTASFSDYFTTNLTVANAQFFQYRAIMESDDTGTNCNYGTGYTATWCSPELQTVAVGPNHYDTTNPTVTSASAVSFKTLSSLTETFGSGACTEGTLYNLSPDGTNWYWYNTATSAWETAIGTITTATASSAITSIRLASFPVGAGNLYFKVFLKSSGFSACVIDNLSLGGTR